MKIEHLPYIDLLDQLEKMPFGDRYLTYLGDCACVFTRYPTAICANCTGLSIHIHAETATEVIDELIRCKVI